MFLCKIEFRVLNKIKRFARSIAASIENGRKWKNGILNTNKILNFALMKFNLNTKDSKNPEIDDM